MAKANVNVRIVAQEESDYEAALTPMGGSSYAQNNVSSTSLQDLNDFRSSQYESSIQVGLRHKQPAVAKQLQRGLFKKRLSEYKVAKVEANVK